MVNYLKNIKEKINIEYIIGLVTVIIVPLCMMLLYWNKSISNYDGWYNLYAQDILSGRIPYLDFHFLMPPVFLYVWTIIQKIFGNYIIVFHLVSIICKCILSGVLYHTFTRFFNVKISTLSALFSSAIMIFAVFDNCTFSYNEFVTLICLILVNLFISYTNRLYEKEKISYKYVFFIAIINSILFFTKQTHGIIVPCGFLILFTIITLSKVDKGSYLKSLLFYILISCITTFLIFIPILHQGIISAYISNVYMGTSAKGSIMDIIKLPLRIVSGYQYLWPVFLVVLFSFIGYILKKYSLIKMYSITKITDSKYIPPICIISISSLLIIMLAFYLNQYFASKEILVSLLRNLQLAIDQIGVMSQCLIFFMAVFYFVRFLIFKSQRDSNRMILYCILTLIFLSIAFSTAGPYFSYYLYGLALASLLNYKSKLQSLFEILSFILILTLIFLITWTKIIIPFAFHGYLSSNIAVERVSSTLPSLKGFKLPQYEIEIYEEIDSVLKDYLNKEDKIFCFINNTVFYNLFNRKPFYSDYYNLYWDVSPESEAKQIFITLKTALIEEKPKAIIYFEYPEQSIEFHEKLFRNGNSDNFQRKIDMLLKTYINTGNYLVIKDYNAENYYKNNPKFSKDMISLLKKTKELDKLLREYDYNKHFDEKKYKKIKLLKKDIDEQSKKINNISTDLDRYFLEKDFKIKILIRKDIYEKGIIQ